MFPRLRHDCQTMRRSLQVTAVRWLTLLSFLAGTVGLPLTPFSGSLFTEGATGTCASNPGSACRCSLISQKLGKCCCSRGQGKATANVCQTSPPAQPVRSCCAGKSKSGTSASVQAPQSGSQPTLMSSSCPCGPSTSTSLLLCGEPRLLPKSMTFSTQLCVIDDLQILDEACLGERLPPELPPPKGVAL